ncbi:hypothetical protein [Desulfovibrio sp.]
MSGRVGSRRNPRAAVAIGQSGRAIGHAGATGHAVPVRRLFSVDGTVQGC